MMISVLNLQFQKSLSDVFGYLYLKYIVHHLLLKFDKEPLKELAIIIKNFDFIK